MTNILAGMGRGPKFHAAVHDLLAVQDRLLKLQGACSATVPDEKCFGMHQLATFLTHAGNSLPQALTALECYKPQLDQWVQEGPFSAQQLAMLVRCTVPKLQESLRELMDYKPVLNQLIEEGPFTASNLSNMLSRSGVYFGINMNALCTAQPALKEMLARSKFTAENISSMLNNAYYALPETLNTIIQQADRLERLVDDKTFTASTVSTLLNGSAKRLEVRLALWERYKPVFDRLITEAHLAPSNFSSIFFSMGTKQLVTVLPGMAARVDRMVVLSEYLTPKKLAHELRYSDDLTTTIDTLYDSLPPHAKSRTIRIDEACITYLNSGKMNHSPPTAGR